MELQRVAVNEINKHLAAIEDNHQWQNQTLIQLNLNNVCIVHEQLNILIQVYLLNSTAAGVQKVEYVQTFIAVS